MKKIIIATTLVGLLTLSGVAMADPGGPMGMFRLGRVLRQLDLTEPQEDALIGMHKEIKREGQQVHRAAVESMAAVAEEVKKPKPDAARLHQLADQRIDDARKLVHFAIDRFLAFHATLDAKQRAELADDLQKGSRRAKKWQQE